MRVTFIASGYAVQVDAADWPLVAPYSWHVRGRSRGKPYFGAWVGGREASLHRHLMGEPEGLVVDHVNHDTCDNTRGNLRAVSTLENNVNQPRRRDNTSGHRGASRKRGGWVAQVSVCGRRVHLGTYPTAAEAGEAYARAREGAAAALHALLWLHLLARGHHALAASVANAARWGRLQIGE